MTCLKKFFVSLIVCISLVTTCLSLSAFAKEYSNNYPAYLPVSNCAYCEVNTTELGTGTLVFNMDYQFDTFCFSGHTGYKIANQTRSTVTGTFITNSGVSYPVRLTSLNTIEYKTSTNSIYHKLNSTEILNTNIQFVDNQNNRGNSITIYSPEVKPLGILLSVLIVLCGLYILCVFVKDFIYVNWIIA